MLVELVTSKLPHYMLTAFPSAAMLVATQWEQRARGVTNPSRRARVAEAIVFLLAALVIAGAGVLVGWLFPDTSIRARAALLVAVTLAYGIVGFAWWRSAR